MRRVFLVTYEFKSGTSTDEYLGLYQELKNSQAWWHYLKNTWLLVTRENAQQIHDRLKPFLDENVNLLIIEVGPDRQGWLPKKAWQWIRKHLPKS